jgi:hypothetical protein
MTHMNAASGNWRPSSTSLHFTPLHSHCRALTLNWTWPEIERRVTAERSLEKVMQDKGVSALGFKLKFILTAKHKMFAYLLSVGNMFEGEPVIPAVLSTYRQRELAPIVMPVIISGMCPVRILAGKPIFVSKVLHEFTLSNWPRPLPPQCFLGRHIRFFLTPLSESASELYRPSDRRLLTQWLPTFADRGCHVVSVTDPYGHILCFLDRSRYFSIK